jgi:hypothetical protein
VATKLTPPEGRSARASVKAAPSVVRTTLPAVPAPADFKPHFVEVVFRTEADGLLACDMKATRYQGRYEPDSDDRKKKRDMSTYDYPTMIGIQARFAAKVYKATNDKKYSPNPKVRATEAGSHRLPPNTVFVVLVRVRKNAEDNLGASVKQVWQRVKHPKTGRVVALELDSKTDPVARLIRSTGRFLPQAFKNVQQPPALARKRKSDEDETVDE